MSQFKLLTLKKISEMTGEPLYTVKNWRQRNGLPVRKNGKRLYVLEDEFEGWFNSTFKKEEQSIFQKPKPTKVKVSPSRFAGITSYDYWGKPKKKKAADAVTSTTFRNDIGSSISNLFSLKISS